MEATLPATKRPTALTTGRVPIKVWASQIEDGAVEQAVNLSNLPFAISHVALMPDAHPGYGMPIGGVLFADKAIVPGAVGVDIGCGVALLNTTLTLEQVQYEDNLQDILDEIARRVPVGNGNGAQFDRVQTEFEISGEVSQHAYDVLRAGAVQLGSLGGGNHFIEMQADAEGNVYVMLHSGSRSVGKKICDHWAAKAQELNARWHSDLPDKELAYLPWASDEGRQYFVDMTEALLWAEANRRAMLEQVSAAINDETGAETEFVVDIHHNYAAWENHLGKNGIVHRKGAVRARAGDVVLIPGSMGTSSYIGEGLGNKESFETCQHGAGRARGRKATLRQETREQFDASMVGIKLGGKASDARDESPFAYKDIEAVMADSTDLVRPVVKLRPLGVVKG